MLKKVLLIIFLLLPLALSAQDPNDCVNALTVCGNTNLSFNSAGPGADDLANTNNFTTCGVLENQSLWLRVPIATSGTLGFTLTPNAADDYDFAIFGPDVDCNNLGGSIRCSFAGTNGATGLNNTETDVSEDGGGNAFVRELDVQAGETYIILIDNFSNSNRGFDLVWNGTAQIVDAPTINTVPDQDVCDVGNDGSEDFDLTTLDNLVANGAPDVAISYHANEPDAILGNNPLANIYSASTGDRIFIRATSTNEGCASVGNFTFNLLPNPEGLSIVGPASVCPDVDNIVYNISGDAGYSYQWSVGGGTIVSGGNSTQVEVNWGSADPNAFLQAIPTNTEGCIGPPVRLDVVINTRLQPALPQGPLTLCITDNTEGVYSVPASNGSIYEWFVEHGTFVSSNNTNEVTIRWNTDQPGRVWLREFNPNIANCEGFSNVQTVNFFPQIFVNTTIENVRCFGEATGSINLQVSGGLAPFNIVWDNGSTATSRSGLIAGDYTYTVTDGNMCQVMETITITEPTRLVIDNITTGNLSCFQDFSGTAEAVVSGGTAPYRYNWRINGASISTSPVVLNGVAAGDYELIITDANNCTTSSNFTLTEPLLLEADLDQLINNPICPQATNGEVTVGAKGGTPDYTFVWELTPQQTGPTATGLARGTYRVIISDMNGCTTSQTVEVQERFPRVVIPSAFSPNGDNINDTFSPITTCSLANFSMVIYNRWGNPVYSSNNIEESWDGTFKGSALAPNQYTYLVSYQFVVNDQLFNESIRGNITLVK